MFNLFGSGSDAKCPIPEDNRLWMEHSFLWFLSSFGEDKIKNVKVLQPIKEDFPITFQQTESDVYQLLDIIARQMDVNPDMINLQFYDQGLKQYSGDGGRQIFSQQVPGEQYAAGVYYGKDKSDKYRIGIDLSQLNDPESIIATISHEIAHIKLLGEKRIEENDEYLTDLVPVIFGLGIYIANSVFKFTRNFDSWEYSNKGYLKQQDFGYALALFAYIRKEKTPRWINYLTTNVKSDFKKGERFIYENIDIIFKAG